MKKNVIVSLADANYFPLLEELINSIRRFKESESIAICILDAGLTEEQKNKVIDSIPLKRMGSEKDIAEAVKFLANSDYITGQIIKVDGGRSL